MLKYAGILLLLTLAPGALAGPAVPGTIEFAGITLTINETARRLIQDDVDALTKNQTYFLKKVEKAAIYFPLIERAFAEENTPQDFKYLIIQESAMIPDAVSVSNAVGFWQFKEVTAREVGLRVDRYVDERMNITASTHGAAKYLKKNNFFFNNWVYALLAYNTGPGGAEAHINKKYLGATRMEITKDTHWYVRKFLAHKIAFEDALKSYPAPDLVLFEYDDVQQKSIKDLAEQFDIDYQIIFDYNKWIRHGKVPDDKRYVAAIPVSSSDVVALRYFRPKSVFDSRTVATSKGHNDSIQPSAGNAIEQNPDFPIIVKKHSEKSIRVNGIPGFIATPDDNLITTPDKYKISRAQFLMYNDLTATDKIVAGQVYYLRSKKTKAKVHNHVVQPGESYWSISQKYGVKMQSLLSKNRMTSVGPVQDGLVLWLRFIRPSDVPVEYRKVDVTNVVVQSHPNNISVSPQQNAPPTTTEKMQTEPEQIPVSEDSEFLFEEVGGNSGYVGDNSFVDLSNSKSSNSGGIEPSPKARQTSANKTGDIYHIVKPGETLFAISRAYNVSIGELRQWNNFDDLNRLNPGERILIKQTEKIGTSPLPTELDNPTAVHYVQKEDTMYSIARKYGLSVQELMELNDKQDFSIREGEALKIKKNP